MRPTRSSCLLLAALALGGCRDSKPGPDAGPDATPSPAPTATADRADPGPRLERPVGEKPSVERPEVVLEVDAVEAIGGAVYLRAVMPPDPSRVVVGPLEGARLQVLGDRPGLAVPAAQGRLPDRPWLYVRLAGEAPPPDPLVVRWRQSALLDGEPGQIQDMRLVGASQAEPFPRLAPRVFEAMDRWFAGGRTQRPTDFEAFASGRARALARGDRGPRTATAEPIDLLSLHTAGVTPFLLRDRGTGATDDPGGEVPLASIEGPPRVGTPWATLDAGSPDAAASMPLARWAPAEWIYVQLAGLEAGLALHDEVEALFGPVLDAYAVDPGDRQLLERRLADLDLDRGTVSALAEATGGAAVLLTDPLLRDGPGMVLVAEVTDATAVRGVFEARDRAARDRGAAVERVTVAGHAFTRVRARGGAAWRGLVDDVLLIANSPAALERSFAAHAGQGALGGSPELKVLRGRLPPSADEVAFAIAGEAHLAALNTPRTRLLSGRRTRALAELRAATLTRVLHGWLEGVPVDPAADPTPAMRATGLWSDADETLFDGSPVTVRGGLACAERWGCTDRGTPLIDLAVDAVTETEAGAYGRLRAESLLEAGARAAPMAVRIERRGGGYAVSGRMLPLVRRHGWLDLTRQLGDVRVAPAAGDGLEVRVAVAPDAPVRTTLTDWLSATTGQRSANLSWLGDHVVLGLAPRSGVWDAVLNLLELPNVEGRRRWRDPQQRKRVLDRLPLYALAPVADRVELDRTLTAAATFASAPGSPISWAAAAPYRGVEVTEVREVLTEQGSDRVGLYLAVAGGTLVVGVERAVLDAAIDRVLAGETRAAAPPGAPQASLRLVLAPGGWMQRAALGAFERFAARRIDPARRAFEAVARGLRLPPPGAARDTLLSAVLGFVPAGPHGDRPTLDADGGAVLPRYGSQVAPKWPAVPVADDPLASLASLEASLGFEGEPGQQGMTVELRWTRR